MMDYIRHCNGMAIKLSVDRILKEITAVMTGLDESEVEIMEKEIAGAKRIITIGAGRVGLAARAFSMRLSHLGFRAYTMGDSNLPAAKKGDLVVVASGSGETKSVLTVVKRAKENKARVMAVTANKKSSLSDMADTMVLIKAPHKGMDGKDQGTIQPMTTLNEQCLQIFFDAVILDLLDRLKIDDKKLWRRHTNLE